MKTGERVNISACWNVLNEWSFRTDTRFEMKRIWTAALSALLLTTGACALDHETRTEGKAAIQKGLAWLVAKQKDDGSWSNERFPALTGLPLWALSEVASEYPEYAANIAAAVAYLKDKAQDRKSVV